MKCLFCGHESMKRSTENVPLSSLRTVTLVAISISTCKHCGEQEIEIPQHTRLIEIVTLALLNKRNKLTGKEIKWLRSRLGWTSSQLAEHVGVSLESISKWENNKVSQTRTADRLLRMITANRLYPDIFPADALPLVSEDRQEDLKLRLKHADGQWQLERVPVREIVADPTRSSWSLLPSNH